MAIAVGCLGGELRQVDFLEVPGVRSAYAPSAALLDDRIALGWRGPGAVDLSEDDQQLYLAFNANKEWSNTRRISGKSMFGPVLAASQKELFIAWHGAGNLFSGSGDQRLFLASLQRDGQMRYYGAVPGALSAGPPGLAVHEGLVYVGWRSPGNITVGVVPGNQHWINFRVFNPQTELWVGVDDNGGNIVHANGTSGPVFAPVAGTLYGLWRGTGSLTFYGPNSDPGDPNIYYGSLDGNRWSTLQLPLPTIPGALTAWSPGAVEWKGGLLVGWRGDQQKGRDPGDETLSFARLTSARQWETIELFEDAKPASAFAPSMAVDPREEVLWVFWRGGFNRESSNDDQQIYSATFVDPDTAGDGE